MLHGLCCRDAMAPFILDTTLCVAPYLSMESRGNVGQRNIGHQVWRHAPVVTSNYVIDETVTWLRYHVRHRAAVAFRETLTEARAAHGLHVEWVSERIEGEAWDVFLRYSDHELSFTDCTSAVIARELGLLVWAYDRDFSTLGFQLVG
ncbi:MAG: type II toxin-antitoxin system VapC family toxin [Bacteroidota bacterium]